MPRGVSLRQEAARARSAPGGANTSAVVVAYTSINNVAIGCLMIHDRSCETSVRAGCAVCSAMIGTSPQQNPSSGSTTSPSKAISRALTNAWALSVAPDYGCWISILTRPESVAIKTAFSLRGNTSTTCVRSWISS
jgi:hypothetical protein